jgi:hypothetical protein
MVPALTSAQQLMAEMMWALLLFPSNVKAPWCQAWLRGIAAESTKLAEYALIRSGIQGRSPGSMQLVSPNPGSTTPRFSLRSTAKTRLMSLRASRGQISRPLRCNSLIRYRMARRNVRSPWRRKQNGY